MKTGRGILSSSSMPFPDVAKEVYKRNLLREVICQFRFPSILRITSELPTAFQERIRTRYPIYERETTGLEIPKEISEMVAGAMLQGFQAPTHKFSTEDKTRLISLNQEFLAISDKKYIRWNDFRHELHQIEEAFR